MGAEYSAFRKAVARANVAAQSPAWNEAHHGLHTSHVRQLDDHEQRLKTLELLDPTIQAAGGGKPKKPGGGNAGSDA